MMVREQRVAAGIGLFAIIYLIGSWRLPRFTLTTVVDAHVFPIGLGLVLLLLSVLYYLQVARTGRTASALSAQSGAERPLLEGVDRRLLYKLWGTTLVYALILSTLGYLVATSLFLGAAMYLLGLRRLTRNLVISVGFSVVTYTVFAHLLDVPLSHGILPF